MKENGKPRESDEPIAPSNWEFDPEMTSKVSALLEERSRSHKVYQHATILGIIIGACVLVAGFVLSMLGLTGSIEWVLEAGSIKTRLANAGPGVVFAVIGYGNSLALQA